MEFLTLPLTKKKKKKRGAKHNPTPKTFLKLKNFH